MTWAHFCVIPTLPLALPVRWIARNMSLLKVALYTAIAVVLIVCLFVGIDLAFALVMTFAGHALGLPWMGEISVLWLILAFWVLPKDWMAINRTYRCVGSSLIDAPLAQIWDEIRPRPRGASYRPVVSRITADLSLPNRFYYYFDPRLTGEGTGQPNRIAVDVTDMEDGAYLRTEYPQTLSLPSWARDVTCSEVFLEQKDEGVEVTFVETLRRLTVPAIFSLTFLNPCRDTARRLKACVEGTEDPSWMGRFMAGIGPDGSPPPEMRRGVLVASLTAIAVLTAISLGVISLILFALPSG